MKFNDFNEFRLDINPCIIRELSLRTLNDVDIQIMYIIFQIQHEFDEYRA